MNINEYKDFMDSMEIKKFSVEELELVWKRKKRRRKTTITAATIIMAMLLTFIIPQVLLTDDDLTILVYAADGEQLALTEELAKYELNLSTRSALFDETNIGIANMKLFFKFEGEGIDTITISCGNDEITRYDLGKVNAYFIKFTEMDYEAYRENALEINSSDDFLQCEFGEEIVTITTLIGNSFTMKYDEQDSQQNGLSMRMKAVKDADSDYVFSTEETILDVKIKYNSGKTKEKKIKIMASDDILSGIEIGLL